MPNRCYLRFFIEVVSYADNLILEIFRPIAVVNVVVIVLSVFRSQTIKNPKSVSHVVVKVPTDKVIKCFDAIIKDPHIFDCSKILFVKHNLLS